ncbi:MULTISPECIES: DegT/DnrJ/EryC1/StrS aminotransferase family protein [unclassified Nocardiopsis]|uniref:DegT/DnrJ/EryC1/StrS family aminotransferase n=1 Tax=unclassified Nocardiopsis TaxID=2649073 RepID=UPI00135B9ED1|nr:MULTISPECIES: DegT/DnrJ/EryC1/StrS family aminotransferase [unclassified Nocardiopsis]
MIPLFKVAMSEEAPDRVAEVLRSGQLEHGPRVEEFEAELGQRLGNTRVTAVNCGTSGLHLALSLVTGHGGGPPDSEPGEVLASPLTFEGTNWPILANGMRIRWVDVDPDTLNVDLDDLERKISPSTRAIMVVHWLGYPVDLDRLRGIVDRAESRLGFRPPVVEDCAQAWGATYRGLPLGNHGNTCVYSFQAIKLLTCGGGGLVVLPEEELHRRAVLRRWFGIDRAADRARGDYDVPEWGFRFPMNDTAAAIGMSNLRIVDPLLARHRENAAYYDKELASVPGVEHTERAQDREPSFWAYPLKVDDRASFMRMMADAGIMTSLISRRNDEHTCAAPFRSELPGLDSVHDRIVYVPVGWWLSDEDRGRVVDAIRSGW